MDIKTKIDKLRDYAQKLGLMMTTMSISQEPKHAAFWNSGIGREIMQSHNEFRVEAEFSYREIPANPDVTIQSNTSFSQEFQEKLDELSEIFAKWNKSGDMCIELEPEVLRDIKREFFERYRGTPSYAGVHNIQFTSVGGTINLEHRISKGAKRLESYMTPNERREAVGLPPIDKASTIPKVTKDNIPKLLAEIRKVQNQHKPKKRKKRETLENEIKQPKLKLEKHG